MPEEIHKKEDKLPPTVDDYNEYLSVFGMLGFFLMGFLLLHIVIAYFKIGLKSEEMVYLVASISGVVLTLMVSFYFKGERHSWGIKIFFKDDKITEPQKKVCLILSFVLYLITLNIITIWAGGSINSYFGNLILLTASLSTYVAHYIWTKFFVSFLTVGSYVLTSFIYIYYDCDDLILHKGIPKHENFMMYYAVAVFVCLISWIVSARIRD